MKKLKILCVHGVGHHPPGMPWETNWQKAIQDALHAMDPDIAPDIQFTYYDHLFEQFEITFWDSIEAVAKLTASAVTAPFRGARGLSGALRWTAGMVVQWVENDDLRALLNKQLRSEIENFKPEVVLGHSLGSLICYDLFSAKDNDVSIKNRFFVSFGSQIANPFVSGNFLAGRVEPLPEARQWFHLYNREDDIFTAPIHLTADNFVQIATTFDDPGIADHNAVSYLSHANTVQHVWGDIVLSKRQPKLYRVPKRAPAKVKWAQKPKERALLVGINEYPAEDMRLQGCVNDVFLMSSILQESGFDAVNMRTVFDHRATADGIRSGHGAQIPGYGMGEMVDRFDEALVPWDFDWSLPKAIIDDWFYDLYSQLPYGLQFVVIFDCCHSGGLTRGNGVNRIRGINPPDDIRHRQLCWDDKEQMWKERTLKPVVEVYGVGAEAKTPVRQHRLGRANRLRVLSKPEFETKRKNLNHKGPYMPALIYACREDEFAYEYRHGSTSYGAFTYTLCQALKESRRKKQKVSFKNLVAQVGKKLKGLNYDQHPQVAGPTEILGSDIPLTL